MQRKSLDRAEEKREFPKGWVEVVTIGEVTIGRGTMMPGWKWSESVKPIAHTDSCQAAHTLYVISGRMRVRMDDGNEIEFGPGDAGVIPPGHDAWVVGNEPCVNIDFSGYKHYAVQEEHEHAHAGR